jgi:nitrite reductase/ring-hydroxylating ferredoxin subunit/DMSO/TMAO reductase YedYZ heme-binding membrane subunit
VSLTYRAVGWNRQKRIYDLVVLGGVLLYLGLFVGSGAILRPEATAETLLIRALGTAAFLLLHVVLSIGPLCRLDPRFLPLLYNRRHLGVTTFVLGLSHAGLATLQFHGMGDMNPLVSVIVANPRYDSLSQFPFQPLGLAALLILFAMAATSHDFFLAHLTAPVWKTLHMLVYVAYGLLVLHVTLGVLQAEAQPLLAGTLGAGMAWVLGLHLVAGFRESAGDRDARDRSDAGGFVDVCGVDEIRENRARIACLSGERVAVFRYDGKVAAVSNVCQHQNGPLGEGKVVDGCITCPWHGFQYDPESGKSPPPFTEEIPTFRVRVEAGRVLVDPRPLPPGTRVEPARLVPDGGRRA